MLTFYLINNTNGYRDSKYYENKYEWTNRGETVFPLPKTLFDSLLDNFKAKHIIYISDSQNAGKRILGTTVIV